MEPSIGRVLVTRERIAARVKAMGGQIAQDIRRDVQREPGPPGEVVLIPILTGAIVFAADLIREMPLKLSLRVVAVSSYPGRSMASKGASLRGDLPSDLHRRHVLIVDDILDSGQTLGTVRDLIAEQSPASLRICVLLRKAVPRRTIEVQPDYVGFDIPDEFVVGYGLDYDGYYRNHPEIAVLEGIGQ